MSALFTQIYDLFILPPGNIAFHLVLTFTIVGTLIGAINQYRLARAQKSMRMVMGLGLLLVFRVTIFLGAILSMTGLIDQAVILPPLDRAITALSLIVIIWLWTFPDHNQLGDTASILMGLLAALGGILSLIIWQQDAGQTAFNSHWIDMGWTAFSVALLLLGGLILISSGPMDWGIGFSMILLLMFGFGLHIVFPDSESHFAGAVRVAQIAAYPLLFALPLRFVVTFARDERQEPDRSLVVPMRLRYSSDPSSLDAFLALVNPNSTSSRCELGVKAAAQAMLSDICYYVTLDEGAVRFRCGYDLISEHALPPVTFLQEELPLLTAALKQRRPLRLPNSSNAPDVIVINSLADETKMGHLLCAPLIIDQKELVGGLILVTPYSQRPWGTEEELAIMKVAGSLATYFQKKTDETQENAFKGEFEKNAALSYELKRVREELVVTKEDNQNLIEELVQIRETKSQTGPEDRLWEIAQTDGAEKVSALEMEILTLRAALEAMEEKEANAATTSTAEDEIGNTIQGYQKRINLLEAEKIALEEINSAITRERQEKDQKISSLKAAHREALGLLSVLQSDNNALNTKLSTALSRLPARQVGGTNGHGQEAPDLKLQNAIAEVERLNAILNDCELRVQNLERGTGTRKQWEEITQLTQSLRQPLASVLGYTDFLLGEQIGILGNLQRKYLERVRQSSIRMEQIVDGLLQTAATAGKLQKATWGKANIEDILDESIAFARDFLKEKNILLIWNVSDALPIIEGDLRGLKQVFVYLLHNAGSVSPTDGEINIEASLQKFSEDPVILVKITDTGGGIRSEDIGLVFEREPEVEKNIQGLDASPVSMALSKRIVTAHGGRIWVESEPGVGASFSILLPAVVEPVGL